MPPMARTMKQWIEHAEKGVVELRGDPSEDYLNPMGLIAAPVTGMVIAMIGMVVAIALRRSAASAKAEPAQT